MQQDRKDRKSKTPKRKLNPYELEKPKVDFDRTTGGHKYGLLALLLLAISLLWIVWQPFWLAPPLLEHTLIIYLVPLLLSMILAIRYIMRLQRRNSFRIIMFCILVMFSCGVWNNWWPGVRVFPGLYASSSACEPEITEDAVRWECTIGLLLSYKRVILEGQVDSPFVRVISDKLFMSS